MRVFIPFTRTVNIGDEIQQNALIDILKEMCPNIKIENIDRDTLSTLPYDNISINDSKVIINGWLCESKGDIQHNIYKQPDSDTTDFSNYNISKLVGKKVLYIGVFIALGFAKYIIREKKYKYHFLENSPIGCRDTATLDFFKAIGVPCYLSGCLTLCLKKKGLDKQYNVMISDTIINHNIASTYENTKKYIDYRRNIARQIVDTYEMSRHVITNRLHAFLPCIAFEVPVSIENKNILLDSRFSGISLFDSKEKTEEYVTLQKEVISRFIWK